MTFDQLAIIILLVGMLVVFALERFRVEIVALSGLAIGFALGLVPLQSVFSGFSNPAVITVVEILLIVHVLARSRAVDAFVGRVVGRLQSERSVIAAICIAAALVSVFMNNIGALALMFPVALSICARLDIAPGKVLMPMSFATLLGGTCSLIGTPANLIVNDWLIAETGGGFRFFDMALAGGLVTAAGLVWIILAAPQVFARARSLGPMSPAASGPRDFLLEAEVPEGSAFAGLALPAFERREVLQVHAVIREGRHVFARREQITLAPGDTILLEGELDDLEALGEDGGLHILSRPGDLDENDRAEAVIMPDSLLLGSRLGALSLFEDRGVRVAALASRRRRIEGRFEDLQIGVGDVLLLLGERAAVREAAAEAGLLLLSPRKRHASARRALPGAIVFAAGVLISAFGVAPPEIAFGGVVVILALMGNLKINAALHDLNWSIILLLAAMIPLGMAVESTGAARVIANGVVGNLPVTTPFAVSAAVLVLAVAITPFVNNASTAVVLSPIAAEISARAGVPLEPLLIAVALGASLDFLTPFGHHNNTIVMGAAGYRFSDFPRLGAPLLVIALAAALAGLWLFWL